MNELSVVEDSSVKGLIVVLNDRDKKRTKRQALEVSIKKWELIHHLHKLGVVTINDGGDGSCALCNKYIKDHCKDCPVKKKTGHSSCNNTPYRTYIGYKDINGLGKLARTFQIHAYNELQFLKSLRRSVNKKGG